MSPSTLQSGDDTDEYDSPADRVCAEWEDKALKRLYPTGEDVAREYLGAANKHDRSQEVIRHFARRVEEEKGD